MKNKLTEYKHAKAPCLHIPKYPNRRETSIDRVITIPKPLYIRDQQRPKILFDYISRKQKRSSCENSHHLHVNEAARAVNEYKLAPGPEFDYRPQERVRKKIVKNKIKDAKEIYKTVKRVLPEKTQPLLPGRSDKTNTEFQRRIEFVKSYWNSSNLIIPDVFIKVKKLKIEPKGKQFRLCVKDFGLRKL